MQVQSGVADKVFSPMALTVEVRVPLDNVLNGFDRSGDVSVTEDAIAVIKGGGPDVTGFKYHFFVTTARNLGAKVFKGESDMQVSYLGEICSMAHTQGLSLFEPYLVAHFVDQYYLDKEVFPKDVRVCFATKPVTLGDQHEKCSIRVQKREATVYVGVIGAWSDYKLESDSPIVFVKEIWPIKGWVS